jgi:hypothetical protein
MTMTSAPIMWYATCDYEYEKDEKTLKEKYEKFNKNVDEIDKR